MASIFHLAALCAVFSGLAYRTAEGIDHAEASNGFNILHLRHGNAQAALFYDEDTAFLAIAGTNGIRDWIDDARIGTASIAPSEGRKSVRAHEGILSHARKIEKAIVNVKGAREVLTNREVYITGHSLGGGVAVLLPLLCEWINVKQIITFGAPRVLSHDSAGRYPNIHVTRFVGTSDTVPLVPLPIRFSHGGEVRFVNGGVFGERRWGTIGKYWRLFWTYGPSLLQLNVVKRITKSHDIEMYEEALRSAGLTCGRRL